MTTPRSHTALLLVALALGATGIAMGLSAGRRGAVEPHCVAGAAAMLRLELAFGLSRKGRVDVSEAEWTTFLDREVTPRFPDGLTVLAGRGQWRNAAGVAVGEPARLLLIWVKPAQDLEARIAAVREAWKRAHDQESVLRADGTSCVSF